MQIHKKNKLFTYNNLENDILCFHPPRTRLQLNFMFVLFRYCLNQWKNRFFFVQHFPSRNRSNPLIGFDSILWKQENSNWPRVTLFIGQCQSQGKAKTLPKNSCSLILHISLSILIDSHPSFTATFLPFQQPNTPNK